MNRYAIAAHELANAGVRASAIRINETPNDNTYCILNYGDSIECFYFERGAKHELHSFQSDVEAIAYFKEWVLSNPTIRVGWNGTVE